MRQSNDDNFPFVSVPGVSRECAAGWDNIARELLRAIAKSRAEKPVIVVECYPGVDELAVFKELQSRLGPTLAIRATEAFHSTEKIDAMVAPHLRSADRYQRRTPNPARRLSLVNFFDAEPLWRFRRTIDELKGGLVLIVGCGASLIAWGDVLVHADLARREARQRFHRNETGNVGVDNKSAPATLKHHRASAIDWPMADRWKRPLIKRWDYVLDTNNASEPKMADAADVRRGFQAATKRPFRVVPACDAVGETENSGLNLDGILEENSLLLVFDGLRIEVPAVDLVFYQPKALLGEAVHNRFGYEMPIGFDALDNIRNVSELLAHGDGWREERLAWDDRPSVEMRRLWFTKQIAQETRGGVNIWKLIEGAEAIIESPVRAFEPVVVYPAETIIVPAAVGRYNIRPHGLSAGTEIAALKASVRIPSYGNPMP